MFDGLTGMLALTAAAGACIPLGGALARIEHLRPRWLENEFRHAVIAFGGGLLLGAVARVLVPEGTRMLGSVAATTAALVAGGVGFMLLERRQARRRHASPQLTAMLSDYLPESIALGGLFASGAPSAPLLALLIGLQNLPEGFNAWREQAARGSADRSLMRMTAMIPLGPLCGLVGWFWLSDQPLVLGTLLLVAAGGILYLTFQDIAPQSRLDAHWAPPIGAVLGFALALAGERLTGG